MSEGGDISEYEVALATTPAPEVLPYDDAERLRAETITRFLDYLLHLGDADSIGKFIILSSYQMSHPSAPQNVQELAEKLGYSTRQTFRLLEKMSQRPPMYGRCAQRDSGGD